MSHLNSSPFSARVGYAKQCLLTGYVHGRAFDDCFENGDGDYVMVRLWQLAERDPQLAAKLTGYGTEHARALYTAIRHLSPRQVGDLARAHVAEFIANLPF